MTKPTLLFLTHRVPHPPNRGDRIRTFHFLEHLAARTNVWLGCLADEPVTDETRDVLNRLCARVAIVPVERCGRWLRAGVSLLRGRTISAGAFESPALKTVVDEWASEASFDAALCSSSALAPYLQASSLAQARRYVDLIDVDSEKWLEYSAASRFLKRTLFGIEGRRLRELEASLSDWCAGLTFVSEPEARLYRAFRPDSPIEAIPNGVDVDYFTPQIDRAAERGCVFVGALDYKPNIDGIVWFARELWPAIHSQRPDATLNIVGREPIATVRELAELPGVSVPGTVPDVRPWLNAAAVAVVPLQIARGVQNKVLEALAMARAVVASPAPLAGLNVQDGTHLFQATQRDEWIAKMLRLLDDASLRDDIGLAGQAYVTAHHRWDQCLTPLMSFLGLNDFAGPTTAVDPPCPVTIEPVTSPETSA
ncbi:TIGR03087 family PEP-CTERM/XrtA system glycosyltransferase [bacterium]|nr:TIGR03087 family PEP-CTERM/XrtA system glycosyltransferase [bacterium]